MSRSMRRIFWLPLLLWVSCTGNYLHVRLEPTLSASQFQCVAVAPFDNLSLTSQAGMMVADMVAAALERDFDTNVMTPQTLLQFSALKNLPLENLSSSDLLQILRNKWGVNYLVRGKVKEYWYTDDPEVYSDKQPAVAIRIEVVETGSGAVVYDVDLAGTKSGFSPGVGSLSEISMTRIKKGFAALGEFLRINQAPSYAKCRYDSSAFRARLVKVGTPAPRAAIPSEAMQQMLAQSPEALEIIEILKQGTRSVLRRIKFEYGKAVFKRGTRKMLQGLLAAMQQYPGIVVELWVHTDNSLGNDSAKALTGQQAEAIQVFLQDQGQIDPARVIVHAVGAEEPILPNINRRNRMINRRVEIQIKTPPGGGW